MHRIHQLFNISNSIHFCYVSSCLPHSEYYLPELRKCHSENFPILFILNKTDCVHQLKKHQVSKLAKGFFNTVLVGSSSIGKGRSAVNGLMKELMDILRQNGKYEFETIIIGRGDDLCTLFRC